LRRIKADRYFRSDANRLAGQVCTQDITRV
jgi:hypothetical protein